MEPTLRATIEELKPWFSYKPHTGILRWAKKPHKGIQVGNAVGTPDSKGRLRFEFRGKSYAVHVVAFAIYHGRWPTHQIDHKNRIKVDNRISNLREATNAENSRNRQRPVGASGLRGVSWHKGKFIARIMVNGDAIHLGGFTNATEAANAYDAAARKYHGQFATTNT